MTALESAVSLWKTKLTHYPLPATLDPAQISNKDVAECDVRAKEALFADRETGNGKSAEQIRAEIIKGAWKTVEITK